MTMHNALNPKDHVDRLYIPRKESDSGLQGIKEIADLAILGLDNYVKKSTENLLAAARAVDSDLIEAS